MAEIKPDSHGLNKAARLRAEAAARQEEATPAPLDPEFPYRMVAFDPLFFGVSREWTEDDL